MTTSDRIVALAIAIVSVLLVVGFHRVMLVHTDRAGRTIVDSRGEPYP